MTGNYPHVCTGIKQNAGKIKHDQPLMTEVLKGVGYRTYALGKLHFVPYAPPNQPRLVHGFEHVDLTESGRILNQFDPKGTLSGLEDYYDYLKSSGWSGYTRAHGIGNNDVRPCPSPVPAEHYVDHWIADCTIRQIDRHLTEFSEKPFFMWMSSPKPHSPYDPPRPYDALYDPRTIPAPFGSVDDLKDRNPLLDQTRYGHAIPSLSPEAWQVIRSYYYGGITFLDAMIGRVIDHLYEKKLLESTVILFTADHGDLLGDFGSCFKTNHLNGSVRVPYIAAGPGIAQGVVSEAFVGLQDILPTFSTLAQAPLDQTVQGKDLSPIFSNPSSLVREHFYSSTKGGCGQSAMVIEGAWKYIYSEANGTEELYNLEEDPNELHNLTDAPNNNLNHFRDALKNYAVEYGDTELYDGTTLARCDVDREHFASLPCNAMGWRWY